MLNNDSMNVESKHLKCPLKACVQQAKRIGALVLAALLPGMFLAPLSVHAATYYIATNGNDSWTGTAPAFASGTTGPWLTFTHINSFGVPGLNAGDVLYVRGGVYDHTSDSLATCIRLMNPAGTSNSPIIISNYPGETPIISNSGPNIATIGLGNYQNGGSWVKIFGINSTNAYRQFQAQFMTNCEIAYCDFGGDNTNYGYNCPFIMYNCSQSNWVHNNTVHDAISDPTAGNGTNGTAEGTHNMTFGLFYGPTDWTSYNIIESNTCYHAGHDTLSCSGPSNVLRNNFVHNEPWFYRYDLQAMASHRCMDVGGCLAFANLIDGNRVQDAGFTFNTPHGIEVDGPGQNIIRRNVFYGNEYSGITIYGQKVPSANYWGSNYIYNNTIVSNGYGTNIIVTYTNIPGAPYYVNSSWLPQITNTFYILWKPAVTVTGSSNNVFVNNLLWGNWSNAFTSVGTPNINVGIVRDDHNMTNVNPLFLDTTDGGPWSQTQPNLALQSGSPAVDAGAWLTTITSVSGSGTSFTVADPNFFFAGMTAATRTLPGDSIQLQGQSATATITSISGNTITVATPLTWTYGQGVALPYSGSAPDVGAFECYGCAPGAAPSEVSLLASPSGLHVVLPDGSSAAPPVSAPAAALPPATALYLNHLDLPVDGRLYNWTNRISPGQVCTNKGTTTTNTAAGVYFAGSPANYFLASSNNLVSMTNSVNSIWIRFTPVTLMSGTYNTLVGGSDPSGSGFYLTASGHIINGSAAIVVPTGIAAGTQYDLFMTAGSPVAVYANGVSIGTYTEGTGRKENFWGLGRDADGDAYANFELADFLIATNYTFTSADMSNLMAQP
jgi:hypothetical protein